MIQSSILLFATGYFLVSGAVRNVPSYVALAGFIVAKVYGLFSVLAPAWLERKIIGRNESSNKLAYDDCVSEASFEETYWTQNSATYLVD